MDDHSLGAACSHLISAVGVEAAQFAPQTSYVAAVRTPREVISLRFSKRLEALRREALARRQADGGVLTPAHRALLQAKLDRLQASYRHAVRNIDPMSVNADGSSRS